MRVRLLCICFYRSIVLFTEKVVFFLSLMLFNFGVEFFFCKVKVFRSDVMELFVWNFLEEIKNDDRTEFLGQKCKERIF